MSWPTVKLGDVAEFINGAAFRPEDWGDEGLKIIRIQNLTDKAKLFNRTKRVVDKKLHIEKEDILVSWSATLGVYIWDDEEVGLLNQHIFKVVPNLKLVDKNYLQKALVGALNNMNKHLHGATMKHVNRGEFLATEIPLPPLAEQQRIAAILDKAELIKRNRELVIEKLDELAQSVFIEMFGNPISNSHGYSIKTLKELGNVKTGGTPPSALDNMFGGDIPFITPGDLNSGVDVRRHLTRDGASQSVVVKKGSALVCCIGATIGKMAKANSECAFNQQINAIEWGGEVDDDYGIFALTLMKPIIISSATSTTLPILNKTSFEKIKFPVPPIEKQAIFSKTVKKLEQLKAMSFNSKNLAINSMASLQSQAFSGQL